MQIAQKLVENIYCKHLPEIFSLTLKASISQTIIRIYFLCLRTGCVWSPALYTHTQQGGRARLLSIWERGSTCESVTACVFEWGRVRVFLLQGWNKPPVRGRRGAGLFSKLRLLQRLLLIWKEGRSCTFSSRPRLRSPVNEFMLLCGQQRHAPVSEKVLE